MTSRDRILNTLLGEPTDRPPYVSVFGPWASTLERWHAEGLPKNQPWAAEFGFDAGWLTAPVNLGWSPEWEDEILRDEGDYVVHRDPRRGIIVRDRKDRGSMPEWLEYPIQTRDDWERFKHERFNPDDPARFPDNWPEWCAAANAGDQPVMVGAFPWGIFGTPRDFVGAEEILLLFYDDPEWVHDMMDYLTDFWIRIYEKVVQDVRVDWIHIWEDMAGRQGSLISGDMFKEFMTPNYRKIRDFCDAHDIPLLSVDTDGDCTEMIPWFLDAGLNVLYPFERQAGCDIVAIRRAFPELGMMCGFDKRAIARGPEAIEEELNVMMETLRGGRYIPGPDHLIPPDTPWEHMRYYCRRWKEAVYSFEQA